MHISSYPKFKSEVGAQNLFDINSQKLLLQILKEGLTGPPPYRNKLYRAILAISVTKLINTNSP